MKLGKILANPAVAIAIGAALVRLPEKISKLGIFNRSSKEQQDAWHRQRQTTKEQLRVEQVERNKRQVANPSPQAIANYQEGLRLWKASQPGTATRAEAIRFIQAAAIAGHTDAQMMANMSKIPF